MVTAAASGNSHQASRVAVVMVHGLERPVLLRHCMDYMAGVTMEMVGNGIYRDGVFY